jgi:hypothetical protein
MKKTFILATLLVGAASLQAEDTAIQLSLTPDVALFSKTTTVRGLSLNIWGENPQWSLTLGFVNGSTGDSGGFSWGLVNYDESYQGVQWGWANYSRESFIGWQRGFVDVSQGTFEGFQSGAVNVSEDTTGLQLGVVNYAQQLKGVQVGFINVAENNPWFTEFPDKLATGFPILNWSF